MGRLNRPALMVYGGTIQAGRSAKGEVLDVVSAFQSYGASLAGTITEEERLDIIQKACPGAGACGGMYTANTMAAAIEAIGHVVALQLVESGRRGGEARRVPSGRRRGPHPARTGPEAPRHHDPPGVRERHRRRHGARRLDQPRAAPARDGALGRRVARTRRLPAHERQRPAALGLQTQRAFRNGGSPRRRRYAGGDEVAALRGSPPRPTA